MNKMLVALCLIAVLLALVQFYPVGVDWRETYGQVRIAAPYNTPGFVNPPWILLLLPHTLLPIAWGNATNFLLNITLLFVVIRKVGGDRMTLLLVLTSPVFFDLARTNNVEWLPLVGLLAPTELSGIILACKPQCLSGAFLITLKRDWRAILPPAFALLISFVVWGWWPARITYNPMARPFNFSVLPVGIPYGIYLLREAWRNDDPYLAAVATPLLVPYIAPYSLVSVLAVVASRWKKAGYWLYFGMWAFTIIEARRIYG